MFCCKKHNSVRRFCYRVNMWMNFGCPIAMFDLVGGLEHFLFSRYIENNHPNWLIKIVQRGWNHQPVDYRYMMQDVSYTIQRFTGQVTETPEMNYKSLEETVSWLWLWVPYELPTKLSENESIEGSGLGRSNLSNTFTTDGGPAVLFATHMGINGKWLVFNGKCHENGWIGATPISGNLVPSHSLTNNPMWCNECLKLTVWCKWACFKEIPGKKKWSITAGWRKNDFVPESLAIFRRNRFGLSPIFDVPGGEHCREGTALSEGPSFAWPLVCSECGTHRKAICSFLRFCSPLFFRKTPWFFASTERILLADFIWSGWWFGTFFIFPYIGNVIIPIDFHIFQRGSNNHQPVMMFSGVFAVSRTPGSWRSSSCTSMVLKIGSAVRWCWMVLDDVWWCWMILDDVGWCWMVMSKIFWSYLAKPFFWMNLVPISVSPEECCLGRVPSSYQTQMENLPLIVDVPSYKPPNDSRW